jgi:hypothetical protein
VRLLITSLFSLLVIDGVAQANSILTFSVGRASFDTVAVSESGELVTQVVNTGDAPLVVTDVAAADSTSAFSVAPTNFTIAAGESLEVTVTFAPVWAGAHFAVLLFSTDADVPGGGLRGLLADGTADGPRLRPGMTELVFESVELGVAKAATLSLTNSGNETLTVSKILTDDGRFSLATTQLTLAPAATTTIDVSYTSTGSAPVADSLLIVSDDPGRPVFSLALKTEETPVNAANARVALALLQGSTTPVAGDTVTIGMTLSPNGDTLTGAEVFLRYDATALAPVNPVDPVSGAGSSAGLDFLINRTEGSGIEGVVHFSSTFNKSKTTTDTLATVTFVVQNPFDDVRTIRLLTDAPLANSQFSRPDGLSFTLPAVNRIQIGNAPPVVSEFPIVVVEEDGLGSIGLNGLVMDLETDDADLVWAFDDIDTLGLAATVLTPSPQTGQVGRISLPQDGFGIFRVQARVTDEGGAEDSTVVWLDVSPTNDPPFAPVYTTPADSSRDLGAPIEFRWVGSDPDAEDVLTYEFRFGPNQANLPIAATGLTIPEFVVTAPSPGATVFWQVVARDSGGLVQEGPVFELAFAEDQTPPGFAGSPTIGSITPISVTITWQTTEAANACIRLATEPDLSDSTTFSEYEETDRVLFQSVLVDSLDAGLTYYYRVVIADEFGNQFAGSIGTFTTAEPNAGDLNDDGTVDFGDALILAASFGSTTSDPEFGVRSDFNGDGVVNFTDLLNFASLFGTVYPQG